MAKIYGEEKTDSEIKKFIYSYVRNIKGNKHDRYHAILSLVPDNGKYILDYGCGWGCYSVAIRDKGNTVKAIDISQNEINICKIAWGEQSNLRFERKTIDRFEEETFDCVLSSQVIEHVHNAGNYLSEINRVLKTRGKLIISLPNILNPRSFLGLLHNNMEERLKKHSEYILNRYDKTKEHINAWDPYHFVNLCSSIGFLMERYIPAEGIPFIKPVKPYIYINYNKLISFSYTMVFSFRKTCYVKINYYD